VGRNWRIEEFEATEIAGFAGPCGGADCGFAIAETPGFSARTPKSRI